MNLSNKLTSLRLVLCGPLFFLLYQTSFELRIAVLFLFVFMILTDIYDGLIARDRNLKTLFGNFLDPVSDKIMIALPLIVFVDFGFIPPWIAVIVVAREFIVTGIRSVAMSSKKVVGSNIFGKAKFSLQAIAIIFMLLYLVFELSAVWTAPLGKMFFKITLGSMYLMAVVTVLSIYRILKDNFWIFKES
ncbi:MAG: CDP-diacylglycerol--glycerol-3-phosphate 3-phosphatidyltransferase [archaeon]